MVGRVEEIQIIRQLLDSNEPEMVAIIGRRRVGKTYLIRQIFKDEFDFEMVGIHLGSRDEQLMNFAHSLQRALNEEDLPPTPKNWMDAFLQLTKCLQQKAGSGKMVIFIDELPWIATRNSDFLKALGHFWNSWASRQNIMVILCGSAASWMVRKLINNKGGLHNRVTRQIVLQPFTLTEAETYLKSRGVTLERYQIVHLYMALGGMPYYLRLVEPGKSAAQNIDNICFTKTAPLRNEFGNLYQALYDHAERHISVIRALASKWEGLTLNEIVSYSGLRSGGTLTEIIGELELAGFITAVAPFEKKKKDTLYRLMDEFSLFYLRFMEQNTKTDPVNWMQISQLPAWKSWSGYAFENICFRHIQKIKEGLQIAGIQSQVYSFKAKATDKAPGIQIDLLIDRNDNCINICEIKFHNGPFSISPDHAEKIRLKKEIFQIHSETKKHLFLTFITTYGILGNSQSIGLIDHDLKIDVLF